MQCAKDNLFSKCYWENWTDTCRKMKLDHLLTPHRRINLKWIKDLNVRHETIENKEEDIGIKILDIACSNFCIRYITQGKENKRIKEQMGLHQTRKFCTVKEVINKIKRKPKEWENIFANTYMIRG